MLNTSMLRRRNTSMLRRSTRYTSTSMLNTSILSTKKMRKMKNMKNMISTKAIKIIP